MLQAILFLSHTLPSLNPLFCPFFEHATIFSTLVTEQENDCNLEAKVYQCAALFFFVLNFKQEQSYNYLPNALTLVVCWWRQIVVFFCLSTHATLYIAYDAVYLKCTLYYWLARPSPSSLADRFPSLPSKETNYVTSQGRKDISSSSSPCTKHFSFTSRFSRIAFCRSNIYRNPRKRLKLH